MSCQERHLGFHFGSDLQGGQRCSFSDTSIVIKIKSMPAVLPGRDTFSITFSLAAEDPGTINHHRNYLVRL